MIVKHRIVKHQAGHHDQQTHDPTKGGGGESVDYDAVFEAAIASGQDTSNLAGTWLKEHFDIPYEMNDWAQYDDKHEKIRNSYVVNDDRTLKNNRALRAGEKPTAWATRIDTLLKSRFKHDSKVYRGAALSQAMVDQLISSKELKDLGFMSVSGYRGSASGYLDARMRSSPGSIPVMFHLSVPSGSRVGIMDPGEFVFPRGTSIKIESYTAVNGKYTINGRVFQP